MLIQLTNNASKPVPKRVFYSYSHKDEELKEKLDEQLTVLKRDGFISTWDDRMIRPGQEWDRVIDEKLDLADIIMLLVSPAFLASEYCQDIEVKRAIERHNEGSARVIPIILKPITCWTEIDEAFKDIVEKIRVTIIEVEFPRSAAGNAAGLTGQWLLKVDNKGGGQNGFTAEAVVAKLKEITNDYSIRLLGVAHEQVSDGEMINIGHLLILSGTPEAYEQTRKLFEDKQLSEALGLEVTEFRISYGSTIQTSSVMYPEDSEPLPEEQEAALLEETEPFNPVIIRGMHVPKDNLFQMHFITDSGDIDPASPAVREQAEINVDYFKTALAVKEENLWVNLSAYESNRMLPKELEGTKMGRNMLAQDCILKRFTASLLHPDHYIGRQYWNEVYEKARVVFGTAEVPLDTFQKVWIYSGTAQLYEHDWSEELLPVIQSMFAGTVNRDDYICVIGDAELEVSTETDFFALRHNFREGDEKVKLINDFTISLFKELVLPVIKKEVNTGKNFAVLRQIYYALIAAQWFKAKVNYDSSLGLFVDSNNPGMMNASILKFERLRLEDQGTEGQNAMPGFIREEGSDMIDNVNPNDPAFDIRDNREFYSEYIKMYRNGLYKCARTHTINGQKMVRMYFSGAVDMRDVVEIVNT